MHDKRTLALMVVAPLLVLSLMYLVFDGDTYHPRIGAVRLPAALTQALAENGADVTEYASEAEVEAALADRKLDAIFRLDGAVPSVKLEGSDPARNRAVMTIIQKMMQAQQSPAGKGITPQAPTFEYLHGSADLSTFDSLSPVLIGLFAFFFVFLIAGVSFLKERTSGTLERLLSTPLRRWEIVIGYMAGFGLDLCQ